MINADKPSLLIVGHPRGLTSRTWEICRKATMLDEPFNRSDGELLNHDRNFKIPDIGHFCNVDDCYQKLHPQMFAHRLGYCIKDVMQPAFIYSYKRRNPSRYKVLYVHRDREQVIARQEAKGWDFPDPVCFESLFREIADEIITFEEVTEKPIVIFEKLISLGYKIRPFNYMDEKFRDKRRRNLQNQRNQRMIEFEYFLQSHKL